MFWRPAPANQARFEEEIRRAASNPQSLRREFWAKAKRVAGSLPFAEDLLAAYYCAFDRSTPSHVKAALLGALAYFVLPFDFNSRHAAAAGLQRRCRRPVRGFAPDGGPCTAGAPGGGAACACARA